MTTKTIDAPEQTEEQIQQEQADAEAGFAAGFKKVAGEKSDGKGEAAAPEKLDAERDAEAKAAEEAAARAKADADAKARADAEAAQAAEKAAYEALPKTLRDQMKVLESLPGTVNKLAGHIGGLANATQRIEQALKSAKTAVADAGGAAPSEKEVSAALSNPEAWAKLKEDFPDWAGPVEAEFAALRAEMAKGKGPAVDVEALRRDVSAANQAAIDQAEERAFIRLKHPDWKTTVNTQEFKAWALEGGPAVERYAQYKALERTDPAKADEVVNGFAREFPQWWADRGAAMFGSTANDAIKLLDGFSQARPKAGDAEAARLKREKRLERAVTPAGTAGPITTSALTDEEAFARGFNKVARAK